jgi:hypothetical protein
LTTFRAPDDLSRSSSPTPSTSSANPSPPAPALTRRQRRDGKKVEDGRKAWQQLYIAGKASAWQDFSDKDLTTPAFVYAQRRFVNF